MEKVEAIKCSYCNMVSMTKSSVIRHEKNWCKKNTNRKQCVRCKKFSFGMDTVYNPHHFGDPGSTDYEIETAYCDGGNDIENPYENTECDSFERTVVWSERNNLAG